MDIVFLFLTPDGWAERALGDTPGAIATVQLAIGAGRELVLD